jgi:hypothetical protein
MTCRVENIFADGDWAILEWRDPNGLRGYFDQLSFFRKQGIPVPEGYLG